MDGPWWAPALAAVVTAIVMGFAKAQPFLTGQKAQEKAEQTKLEEARAKLDARTLKYVEARAEKWETKADDAEKGEQHWRAIAQRWFNEASRSGFAWKPSAGATMGPCSEAG